MNKKLDVHLGTVTRNDTGLSDAQVKQVAAHLEKNGVLVEYGATAILLQPARVAEASFHVSKLLPTERAAVMDRVRRALDKFAPKFESGDYSKTQADDFAADMALWHAFKGLTS